MNGTLQLSFATLQFVLSLGVTVCTINSYGYIPSPKDQFTLDQLFSPVVFLSTGQMVPASGEK